MYSCSEKQCSHHVQVKAGHQVEYLKAWLAEQPDALEEGTYKLMFEEKELIDPLSFMDYPAIASAGRCTIEVVPKS